MGSSDVDPTIGPADVGPTMGPTDLQASPTMATTLPLYVGSTVFF